MHRPPTELKIALALSRGEPRTPYRADTWERLLSEARLSSRYPTLVEGLRRGFIIDFPAVAQTQAPENRASAAENGDQFDALVTRETAKGRYIGPFTRDDLECLLGPFQSSPISIIPKPAKPGHFRIIQNFSFPRTPTPFNPNPSVNSFIDSSKFPCTWGTFASISLLIWRLPPGSQAATRDIAEAYRTIPLHPSQWPAAVVRANPDNFYVDTCLAFGAAPSAGVYGTVADAGADLARASGLGPLEKWVDDHFLARMLRRFLAEYNRRRLLTRDDLRERERHHRRGRLWFGGYRFDDGTLDQSSDDCEFPCRDHSQSSPRPEHDREFTYNLSDVDTLFNQLGDKLWELSKDSNFAYQQTFTGFVWDLVSLTVGLPESKKTKYLGAIATWQGQERGTHNLEQTQGLYGKLLHACMVVPRGRAYLTGLEAMLKVCSSRPFTPHSPVASIRDDLRWWVDILRRPILARPIPFPRQLIDMAAFSDASSGIGVAITVGDHWRAWRLIPGWQTLDGKRDIAWAEAVGFELLTLSVTRGCGVHEHYRLWGDNQGVVEGWWNHRSRNGPVNEVFKHILAYLDDLGAVECIHTAYVASASNPADGPSRGIYPSASLLLPPVPLPAGLERFLVDATSPPTPLELRLRCEGKYPKAAAKCLDRALERARATEQRESDDLLDEFIRRNTAWESL